ncbi:MAG: NAD(P)-binding domain-containing protein [Acidobacteriota bacterium]|nr:NAD(P)-binding domain-containing protein [Blastocatellia bacterium]MDW8412486.1 NAD(P)-binding domain-containing protein [Acidobacteriota bacterium]
MREAKFIVRRKDIVTDELVIESDNLTIGSSTENDLLLNHPSVSRLHAGIAIIEGDFWIQNLSKSNGTLVNGSPIEIVQIQPGDTVQIGVFILKIDLDNEDIIIEVERTVDSVAAGNLGNRLLGDPRAAMAAGKTALLSQDILKVLEGSGFKTAPLAKASGRLSGLLGTTGRLQRGMTGLLTSILALPEEEQKRFQQTMDAFWERRKLAQTGGAQKLADKSELHPKEIAPEYKQFNLHLGKKRFNWRPTADLIRPWPKGFLLTFGSFILLIGAIAIFFWEDLYSPGNVSAPHAATESDRINLASFLPESGILLAAKTTAGNKCSACHAAAGPMQKTCIGCHTTEHFNPQNAIAAHNAAGLACVDCHTEHKGTDFRPATVARTMCFDCHKANPSHPKARKQTGEPLGIPHGGRLGYPVVNGEWKWTEPINKKIQIPDAEILDPKGKFHFVHMRGDRNNTARCTDCHTSLDKPKEIDQKKCAVCHTVEYDPQGNPQDIEDVQKLTSLAGTFDIDCNSCHIQHSESPALVATLRPAGGRGRKLTSEQVYKVDTVYRGGSAWEWTSFAAKFGGLTPAGWAMLLSLLPISIIGFVLFDSRRKRKTQDKIKGKEIEIGKSRSEPADIKYALKWDQEWIKRAEEAAKLRPVPQPIINYSTCIGCHSCILVCPQDVLGFDEQEHHAIVVNYEQCMEDTGCQQACPTVPQSCVLINTKKTIREAPKPLRKGASEGFETEHVEGIYLVGDVSGVPLIRNAIKEGRIAVEKIAEKLKAEGRVPAAEYDVAIVGIGPGGISATARAAELGLSYIALEQSCKYSTIAEKYPAGKYVAFNPFNPTDPPLGAIRLEGPGDLKENMLRWWDEACAKLKLKINEYEGCTEIVKEKGFFIVKTKKNPAGYKARKVVLALGNAGEPRKLGVPGEVEGRVEYRLQDPSAYKGKHIVVVGAGNSAVEAAVDLTGKRQPDGTVIFPKEGANEVTLVIRSDFPKDLTLENKMWVYYCIDHGKIKAYFGAAIKEIREKEVVLAKTRDDQIIGTIPNDIVFALVGSIPPKEFLQKVGIKYSGDDKKK